MVNDGTTCDVYPEYIQDHFGSENWFDPNHDPGVRFGYVQCVEGGKRKKDGWSGSKDIEGNNNSLAFHASLM